MTCFGKLLAIVAVVATVPAASGATTESRSNPIRKVVTMLQKMQTKVAAEGKKADDLFEQFECYCKNSGGDLTASIEAAETKLGELGPGIEAATSKKAGLDKALASHQEDLTAAKAALDEATAIREKEKAAFDKDLAESKTNIAALKKAVGVIQAGMGGGSFLQSSAARHLRIFLKKNLASFDGEYQEVVSFLSGEQGDKYSPASGEIVGLLGQLGDEMAASQKDMIEKEEEAVKNYDELVAAKKKEKRALTESIQEKQERLGQVGIEIAEMKNDKGDTAQALSADKGFLQNMEKNCATKAKTHEEEKKMRSQELVALADTIKFLNDDDALELFKKTLPSADSSFLQLKITASAMSERARALLAQARSRSRPARGAHRVDFILLALSGKKVGFDKVLKMIDDLVATLKQEQQADEDKKTYCSEQFDATDDKKKGLQQTISDLETASEETKEGVSNLAEEIKAMEDGIKALDKSVSDATEQRKQEHAEFQELLANNKAAKELILMAKKRMNKFYNPKLVEGGSAAAFLQLASHREAPPPPPETMEAYTKKGGESNGVISMMDVLVGDLDKEMTVAETEEKIAQEEYEQTMKDSAEKRTIDSQSVDDKESAKADMQSSLETTGQEKKSSMKELEATVKYISNLHGDCDFLMQYFDVRKEARADEIDSLEKAKAVLSGADYALVQQGSSKVRTRKFLRHA